MSNNKQTTEYSWKLKFVDTQFHVSVWNDFTSSAAGIVEVETAKSNLVWLTPLNKQS